MENIMKCKVYRASVKHWGHMSQTDKLVEEMSELTKEILKARRKGSMLTDELIEEFGDVSVMMEQLRVYYNDMTKGEFDSKLTLNMNNKIARIHDLLEDRGEKFD